MMRREYFDYDRQAWIVGGRYVRCGHPAASECGCYGRAHAGELAPYYTVLVPYSDRPTKWHPTEPTGTWSVLNRGAFSTDADARAWGDANLAGEPYTVRRIDPEVEL